MQKVPEIVIVHLRKQKFWGRPLSYKLKVSSVTSCHPSVVCNGCIVTR